MLDLQQINIRAIEACELAKGTQFETRPNAFLIRTSAGRCNFCSGSSPWKFFTLGPKRGGTNETEQRFTLCGNNACLVVEQRLLDVSCMFNAVSKYLVVF
jgi:hypothetical protein